MEPHPGGVPIAEAAERLGLGVELLRKRAQRGTLPAYKLDGKWFVVLDNGRDDPPAANGPVLDTPSRPGPDTSAPPPPSSAVSPAARSQLEAIRDEWLLPLVERAGALEREVGRLQAERDAAEQRRAELAAELEAERRHWQRVEELAVAVERREAEHRRGADQLVEILEQDRDAAVRRVAAVEAERDRLARERDDLARQLQVARDAARASPAPPGATERPKAATDTPAPWWRRVRWLRDRDRD